MDAFESALESLDIILCDENIFTVTKYSNWATNENVIYFNIGKIGKKHEI